MRMRKSIYLVIMLLLAGNYNLLAQGFNMSRGASSVYWSMPQEGIYIHQNGTQLFAGERLYYKVYCLNLKNGLLSDLSKIAYVKMIDDNMNTVFSHTIRLNKGTGMADFALPSDLLTGSYKIIGYTNWMLSRNESQYFESDLIIINPYKVIPEKHLEPKIADSIQNDSIQELIAVPTLPAVVKQQLGDNLISIKLDQEIVKPRSIINIQLEGISSSALQGEYSLTVKKVNDNLPMASPTAINCWSDKRSLSASPATREQVIPELRGELYSGKVVRKDSQQGVAGRKVVLSLPGDPYILDIAQTDAQGNFYFNMDTPVNSSNAVFQLLDANSEDYEISVNETREPEMSLLEFPVFKVDRTTEDMILERSINNQIENAFALVKSDTVVKPEESVPFYRDYGARYYLDDYTRFNTLRETMVEIIDHAWIAENGDQDPTFGVRPFDGYLESTGLQPVVLVDGLFIRDHKDVVNYNSKEVRSIAISRDRIMIGPQLFQGLISLETKAGEFQNSFFRAHLVNDELKRPEVQKTYFFQQYNSSQSNSRIPDFRYQLFWEPSLTFGQNTMKELLVYSSDIKGKFEVSLRGFTETGQPVSLNKTFIVE